MSENKTILVTGGLGYIGSHTVVELINNDYNVVVVDNLVNSKIEILDQIENITGVKPVFYQEDLVNFKNLKPVFENEKIDAVIHFAAHLLVGESVSNPLKYYRNNLLSLINVLEVMEGFKVNKLIFSSSCTVYGNPENFPIDENTSIGTASSPYGTTKIFGEKIIEDTFKSSDQLNAVLLRYFNPVGAHESGLIGELTNDTPAHLFPILAEAFRENTSFKVFGNDYGTKDGSAIRDYIHVVDVAMAHVSALNIQFDSSQKELKHYNIGTGKGVSVLEIINEFKKVTKKEIEVIFEKRREGDVEEIWAKPNLANEELQWHSQLSLEEMVRTSVLWDEFQQTQDWV